MKKNRTSIYLISMLCIPSFMKAEGQAGIGKIFSFFELLMIISNGFIFTVFIGFLIKLILKKMFKNLSEINIISFSSALFIVLILQICYRDKFTYLIYNNL